MGESVANLKRVIDRVLQPMIGRYSVGAMIDFPNYSNVGDSAIYLGQLAWLESVGISGLDFICDFQTYDRRALAKAVGDRAILLTGGGSFGDLWPVGQTCREDILLAFPGNPVIQLPQTMHFQGRPALDRARAAVDKHRNLTLLWRDEHSLETARREFNAASELCPDMAFCLGSLERPPAATQPIVWISRNDKEKSVVAPTDSPGVTDWPREPYTPLRRLNDSLTGVTIRFPRQRFWRALLTRTFSPLATSRLRAGLRTLGRGEVVITDRLHGHILSMLLGIPHVILDNSYGKLSSFHKAWTCGVDGVQFARSADEAIAMASELAGAPAIHRAESRFA